jgi:hypothetical protein
VVAATLGLLDLTSLEISISWSVFTLILTLGLGVAQYRVWLDQKSAFESIGTGEPHPERLYDLGVNMGELNAVETLLRGLRMQSSSEDYLATPLLRRRELVARLRAIMAELGWPFSEDSEHLALEIQGMASGLGPKHQAAFKLGREVANNVDMLLWQLNQHVDENGTQLSVNTSFAAAVRDTCLASVRKSEELAAELGVAHRNRLRNFVTDWTSYSGTRSMERWFSESDDVKSTVRADISRSLTGISV